MNSFHQQILRALILSLLFVSGQSIFAVPVIFEDFSTSISLNKFTDAEQNIELDTANQNLILSQKGSSHYQRGESNSLGLVTKTIEMLQADMSITSLSLGNPSTQQALVRLGGYFYETNDENNIWTVLVLGDRGNGLEAWYEIRELDSSTNTISLLQGTLGTGLSLNTPYTASISFDSTDTFTFVFNSGSPVVVTGPARVGLPESFYKFVGTRIDFGRNSTPLVDASPDDGSATSISATIDNVITDQSAPSLLDDFSDPVNLDISKWSSDEISSEIVTNQLEIKVKNQGNGTSTQRFSFRKTDNKRVGATVTILSSSDLSAGSRVRARVLHILGNDTYNEENGDVFNGNEGDIFTFISLQRVIDGSLRADIYASKVTNADFTTEDQLFYKVLFPPVPVALDLSYALEIEQQSDTVVNYKIDGITYHTFNPKDNTANPEAAVLSGNLHPASDSAFTQLQTRLQYEPGEVYVRYDDIITNDENRNILTRAAIAKHLLQAIYGKAYIPPTAGGILYSDVNVTDFNADWIEKLAVDGITEGCATGKYCPNMIVTKEQLSKLLLKTKHSSAYMPASPTGTVFNDVSLGSFAADWIEELASQGISAGCDTDNFCSQNAVTITTVEAMADRALP